MRFGPDAPTARLPLQLFLFPVVLVFVAVACGGDGEGGERAPQAGLAAQVASYDLAVGPPARLIVGVFNPEKGPVGYGTVELRFSFLGETEASIDPRPGPTATGRYLPLPGSPPPPAGAERAQILTSSERGVYSADVGFDKAGFWQVEVSVDLDPSESASTAFQVLPRHEVPFVGDAAIPSRNLTLNTPGASPAAVDSRADDRSPVPDPELHQTTVAEAMAAGRPVLLTISTPTFCVSRFCGPVTDMAAELAKEYGDRASFVHIEVWGNFEANQLNDAAREWIARGQNVNEPWLFLIGADGDIAARWDNVATRGEIEPLLEALPVIAG